MGALKITDMSKDELLHYFELWARGRKNVEEIKDELLRRLEAAVSASPQPRCPEHKVAMVQKVDRKVPFWGCPSDGCGLFISVELLNQVAQFFAAAPAQEPKDAVSDQYGFGTTPERVVCNWRQDGNPPFNCKLPADHVGNHSPKAAQEQPVAPSPQKGKP